MTYVLKNGQVVQNLSDESKKILDILIRCIQEADSFICKFLMCSRNENTAVMDYRLHRIEQNNMSLDLFLSMYYDNSTNALQELFKQPIKKVELELLTNKINSGTITITTLYNRHKQFPRAKLLRLLL